MNCETRSPRTTSKTSQLLHFAHANGFPAGSYQKLFSHFDNRIRVIALDKFAHNTRFPLIDNWENQVEELIEFTEAELEVGQKCVCVGHSFGAVVSYMAACKRPDIFSQLIMLDPPLVTGLARYVFRLAKKTKFIDKLTPAGITDARVRKWRLGTDLIDYFSKKPLFKNFDKDCLQDYVQSVIKQQDDNLHLNFDVETEANIFRTIPHNLPQFKNKLTIPATLITGKYSDVCVPVLYKPFLKANPKMRHIQFEYGKHMFPLEHPVQLAEVINNLVITN